MASIERLGDGSTAEAWPGHPRISVHGVAANAGCYGGQQ